MKLINEYVIADETQYSITDLTNKHRVINPKNLVIGESISVMDTSENNISVTNIFNLKANIAPFKQNPKNNLWETKVHFEWYNEDTKYELDGIVEYRYSNVIKFYKTNINSAGPYKYFITIKEIIKDE